MLRGNGISSSNDEVPPWRRTQANPEAKSSGSITLLPQQPAGPPPAKLWPQQHAGPPPEKVRPRQHAYLPPAKVRHQSPPQLMRVGKPRFPVKEPEHCYTQGYEAPRPKLAAHVVPLAPPPPSPTAALTPRPTIPVAPGSPPAPSSSSADVHIYHAVGVGHFDLQTGDHIARRHISMPGQASRVRRSVQRQLYQDYGSFLENLLCLILAVGTQVLQT